MYDGGNFTFQCPNPVLCMPTMHTSLPGLCRNITLPGLETNAASESNSGGNYFSSKAYLARQMSGIWRYYVGEMSKREQAWALVSEVVMNHVRKSTQQTIGVKLAYWTLCVHECMSCHWMPSLTPVCHMFDAQLALQNNEEEIKVYFFLLRQTLLPLSVQSIFSRFLVSP